MEKIDMGLTALVALEHLFFLVLEMFLWTKPRGRKAFGITLEFAEQSKALAANQGLYNGFLAAGLLWGMLDPDPHVGAHIRLFFLACILVAAVFGGVTVKRSILWIQGVPAAAALIALHLAGI